jgi:hypothetical protein
LLLADVRLGLGDGDGNRRTLVRVRLESIAAGTMPHRDIARPPRHELALLLDLRINGLAELRAFQAKPVLSWKIASQSHTKPRIAALSVIT